MSASLQPVPDLDSEGGQCPDGGDCHHECSAGTACLRVEICAPLSGVFPGDRWPAHVRLAHVRSDGHI